MLTFSRSANILQVHVSATKPSWQLNLSLQCSQTLELLLPCVCPVRLLTFHAHEAFCLRFCMLASLQMQLVGSSRASAQVRQTARLISQSPCMLSHGS